MNTIINGVLNYVLAASNGVVRNLKNHPNQAHVGIGRPMHKLSPQEVVVARVVMAAVVAALEISLEKN